MDEKYCPLLLPALSRDNIPVQCKRECCAWWHTYDRPSGKSIPGRCALVSVADALTDMNLIGLDINSN